MSGEVGSATVTQVTSRSWSSSTTDQQSSESSLVSSAATDSEDLYETEEQLRKAAAKGDATAIRKLAKLEAQRAQFKAEVSDSPEAMETASKKSSAVNYLA
jgi:hypothetical protein